MFMQDSFHASYVPRCHLDSRGKPCSLKDTVISLADNACHLRCRILGDECMKTTSLLTAPSAVHLTTCFSPESQHLRLSVKASLPLSPHHRFFSVAIQFMVFISLLFYFVNHKLFLAAGYSQTFCLCLCIIMAPVSACFFCSPLYNKKADAGIYIIQTNRSDKDMP